MSQIYRRIYVIRRILTILSIIIIIVFPGCDVKKNKKERVRTKSNKGLSHGMQRLRNYLYDDSVKKITMVKTSNSLFNGSYEVWAYLKSFDSIEINVDSEIDFFNALIYIGKQIPKNVHVPVYENNKIIYEVAYIE